MSLPAITARYSSRHKQESRKDTAVKLTEVADVDSHEKQDAPVDNTCYMKLASKLKYLLVYMNTYPCVFCAVLLYDTSNF